MHQPRRARLAQNRAVWRRAAVVRWPSRASVTVGCGDDASVVTEVHGRIFEPLVENVMSLSVTQLPMMTIRNCAFQAPWHAQVSKCFHCFVLPTARNISRSRHRVSHAIAVGGAKACIARRRRGVHPAPSMRRPMFTGRRIQGHQKDSSTVQVPVKSRPPHTSTASSTTPVPTHLPPFNGTMFRPRAGSNEAVLATTSSVSPQAPGSPSYRGLVRLEMPKHARTSLGSIQIRRRQELRVHPPRRDRAVQRATGDHRRAPVPGGRAAQG